MINKNQEKQAGALGAEAGKNQAGWYFDGNTSRETYENFLRGSESGDPAVMDNFVAPVVESVYGHDWEISFLEDCGYTGRDDRDIVNLVSYFDFASNDEMFAELERIASGHFTEHHLSTDDVYTVSGYRGVAWVLEDSRAFDGQIPAHMVGDNITHQFDVADFSRLPDEDEDPEAWCRTCGQTGHNCA